MLVKMSEESRRSEDYEPGPGAAYTLFVVMEELLDKLKLLNYEEEVLRRNNVKSLSRHYFALPTNPGEQFFMFTTIAAWLINKAGCYFEQPQEYDDPNATVSKILKEFRNFGGSVDFPPLKLKTGSGENVCNVLDRLAEEALKATCISWKRPNYPTEAPEEGYFIEDIAEFSLDRLEEEITEEPDDYEDEHLLDLEALKEPSYKSDLRESSKPDNILESCVDASEWKLETERVLPQLKVTIRSDKDWRVHVEQMHQHKDGIESSLKDTKGYLNRLQDEISATLEKVGSREKNINTQMKHLIQEYRVAQSQLSEAKERFHQGSSRVTERTRILAEIAEELDSVKQEMEEKGSSISDGAPLVKIKQSLTKLKQEIIQMDIRIGLVEHTLLQAKLKEKSNMTRDIYSGFPTQNRF
ncbi:intraflagellar transport protein 57 homolog [Polypterus senegalus]|nr:intraflagellar transport protein 57 homolog [Polypterus senegalus]